MRVCVIEREREREESEGEKNSLIERKREIEREGETVERKERETVETVI